MAKPACDTQHGMNAPPLLAHVGHWYLWVPYLIPVLIVLGASYRAFRQQRREDRARIRPVDAEAFSTRRVERIPVVLAGEVRQLGPLVDRLERVADLGLAVLALALIGGW